MRSNSLPPAMDSPIADTDDIDWDSVTQPTIIFPTSTQGSQPADVATDKSEAEQASAFNAGGLAPQRTPFQSRPYDPMSTLDSGIGSSGNLTGPYPNYSTSSPIDPTLQYNLQGLAQAVFKHQLFLNNSNVHGALSNHTLPDNRMGQTRTVNTQLQPPLPYSSHTPNGSPQLRVTAPSQVSSPAQQASTRKRKKQARVDGANSTSSFRASKQRKRSPSISATIETSSDISPESLEILRALYAHNYDGKKAKIPTMEDCQNWAKAIKAPEEAVHVWVMKEYFNPAQTQSTGSTDASHTPSQEDNLQTRIATYVKDSTSRPCVRRASNKPNEGKFQCVGKCGLLSKRAYEWDRHQQKRYPDKVYVCSICLNRPEPVYFIRIRKDKFQKEHVKKHHSDQNIEEIVSLSERDAPSIPCQCGFCGETFTVAADFRSHVLQHFNDTKMTWSVERDWKDPWCPDPAAPSDPKDDDDGADDNDPSFNGDGARDLSPPGNDDPDRVWS
ncbi:hypothetical protein K402DRAFT_233686 [Aulographum hederae CBS 113979]|uniref:C2H2-type domain-containing protein n=1 Tax=Aulographum hederae CBS 113979 TaxID=1176131 RepID=A0A6G1GKX6_9PEZI|nr:hypothetical protein K402DRAFT_233686 [Aulographum hederae CBS 113979]